MRRKQILIHSLLRNEKIKRKVLDLKHLSFVTAEILEFFILSSQVHSLSLIRPCLSHLLRCQISKSERRAEGSGSFLANLFSYLPPSTAPKINLGRLSCCFFLSSRTGTPGFTGIKCHVLYLL